MLSQKIAPVANNKAANKAAMAPCTENAVLLRWTRLKASLDAGPVEVSRQVEWTDPFVGLRLFVDLDERWNIFAEGDIGGFRGGSDLSLNGQIYLGYRTELFTVPTVLRVGYRALYQDYRTNNTAERFEWNVTQHGPVVGLSMRF